jgi:hypothetical protein
MVLVRGLGWLLMGLAVAVAVRDGLTWWSDGALHAQTLQGLWLQLDYPSLKSLEAFIGRHLSPRAWAGIAAPALAIPVLPAFVIAGLLLLWLGQRRDGRPESSFVTASRPPRRRRGRGSLS